jgi:hypothetical protein
MSLETKAIQEGRPRFRKFKGKDYLLRGILGGESEGIVYLVERDGRLFALKEFYPNESQPPEEKHLQMYRIFSKHPLIKVASVVDADVAGQKFLLKYLEGLTVEDIDRFITVTKWPDKNLERVFVFYHAVFENWLIRQVGSEISQVLGDVFYFNPHSRNVLYNPVNDTWALIDPH